MNLNIQEVSNMLLQQLPVPKELFEHSQEYCFPSLIIDNKGFFTGDCIDFHNYNIFTNKGEIIQLDKDRDLELELFILNNKITLVEVDLDKSPFENNKFFESTKCSIYPENIKDIPSIYDTLFVCDYILKYIYRILMQSLVLGHSTEQIVTSNYLISYKSIEEKYPICNIHKRVGFTKLLNTIRLFSLKNKSQSNLIKESYQSCRSSNNQVRINLNFPQINYSLNDEYLQFHPLIPNISISYGNDEIPFYLTFVKKFIEEYYQDIKIAFPIYNRLENIYRLCSLVRFRQNNLENRETPSYELIYTRTFPDRIMCCGGITLTPKLFVKIPFKDHPEIKQKEAEISKDTIKECRKAFDNGGLICAFAPKLKIRECYDKNLQDFHECLDEK